MSVGGRQRTLGSGNQHVLDYLKRIKAENPSFFYATQGDGDGNIFWADSTFRVNYHYFGDTIRLDTSYKARKYRVPFVSLTGLNHHGQPVLFGCALLNNDSQAGFIWLLQNWLHAMTLKHPVSITTDPDRHIQTAVAQVLPETRHRFCKWSIFRETHEKLAHIYQTNPIFDMDFKKCIDETDTVDEFEACWQELLERYSLMDNEWLQSIYNARHQWVPVYMRDTFFGELYTTKPCDIDNFFDGYVNETTNLQSLTKQYENAVAGWQDMEIKADFGTTSTMPVLKTPSPMEKQAANLYSRRAFIKFQEELVETLANQATKVDDNGTVTSYRVAKFGEEHKAHIVGFSSFDMKAHCSCRMFEFSGIVCRHVLSVFRAKNVLMLPSQLILKRWTMDAKKGGVMEDRAPKQPPDSLDSLTVRQNNLRHQAIKFVEEGAKSIHVYNVAMDALQAAAKRVAVSKKQSSRPNPNVIINGGNGETDIGAESQGTPYLSKSEKEKKIRELTLQLESANQRCEVYRANLLAVLRDMEEQKLKLSVKVQNARLSLKE